ncbi:MAG: ATP-binding protein [Candidatus Korobacteraceae bacterium]
MEPATISKELVFTGDRAAMIVARDTIMDFVRDYCSSEQEEIDILLALQEALANAVLHGSKSDPSKTIHCRVDIDPSAIVIVVRDSGPGFDLAAVDAAGPNLTEHGRGITMMKSLMDEVSYSRGGSEVQLKKFRATKQ